MTSAKSIVPLCRHTKTNGRRCQSPALKAGRFCYFHQRLRRAHRPPAVEEAMTSYWQEYNLQGPEEEGFGNIKRAYPRQDKIRFPPLEDAESVQLATSMLFQAIATGQIHFKRARLLIYTLKIACINQRALRLDRAEDAAVAEPPAPADTSGSVDESDPSQAGLTLLAQSDETVVSRSSQMESSARRIGRDCGIGKPSVGKLTAYSSRKQKNAQQPSSNLVFARKFHASGILRAETTRNSLLPEILRCTRPKDDYRACSGTAAKRPCSGTAAKRPCSGTAAKRPCSGTAAKRPCSGTAAKRPCSGTAAKRPCSGTAAKRPCSGTAAKRPCSGTAAKRRRRDNITAWARP